MPNNHTPKHGPRANVGENAKDFKGAILRLFKELKGFQILIELPSYGTYLKLYYVLL